MRFCCRRRAPERANIDAASAAGSGDPVMSRPRSVPPVTTSRMSRKTLNAMST